MNKLNRDITKSIKQIKADMVAKYQNLFKDLKKKGVIVLDDWAWDRPNFKDFKTFGADAKLYVRRFLRDNVVTKISNYEINELVECPDCYVYVTADEIMKFKTVTYPKLYAEWHAEQKRKHAANGKDAAKLRAKIEKLQRQLEDLEA